MTSQARIAARRYHPPVQGVSPPSALAGLLARKRQLLIWAVAAWVLALGVGFALFTQGAEGASAPGVAVVPVAAPRSLTKLAASSAQPLSAPQPPTSPGGVLSVGPRKSRVALTSSVEVVFDAPVDQASVVRSVRSVPEVKWRASWDGDRLRLDPRAPLKSGTTYQMRVAGRLQSGEPIAEAAWEFRTEVPRPKQVVAGKGGNLILSFDDGPLGARRTTRLLDLLARYQAKALFFPTGQNLERHPRWISDVEARGHRVCNHSYTHPDLTSRALGENGVREEIAKGAGAGRCRLLRPPMMAYDPRVEAQAKELGYSIFLWDIDTRDWEDIPFDEIAFRALRAVEPGHVILFHLQARHTYKALKVLLPKLLRLGYVLSWDPRDVEQPDQFGVGGQATWLTDAKQARARWLSAFSGREPEHPNLERPWPFPLTPTAPPDPQGRSNAASNRASK